jgi:lipoyl-dependent peroxiredoxin
MAVRNAQAHWEGTLKEGKGTLKTGSNAFGENGMQYNFTSRFEEGNGTNPEELIGAAHAGCFTMALNSALDRNGTLPNFVHTDAKVHIGKNEAGQFQILQIDLITEAEVPGLDNEVFQKIAEETKTGCIISRALNIPTVNLTATLK